MQLALIGIMLGVHGAVFDNLYDRLDRTLVLPATCVMRYDARIGMSHLPEWSARDQVVVTTRSGPAANRSTTSRNVKRIRYELPRYAVCPPVWRLRSIRRSI